MKRIETRTNPKKAYRPSVPDRQENRPTFDRFPEYALFPMDCFRLR